MCRFGSVDDAGFENFGHKNNLEQLLINYANESLQGDFNKQVRGYCRLERTPRRFALWCKLQIVSLCRSFSIDPAPA